MPLGRPPEPRSWDDITLESVFEMGPQGQGLWTGGKSMTHDGTEAEWIDIAFGRAVRFTEVRSYRNPHDEYNERFPRSIKVLSGGAAHNNPPTWPQM